MLVLGINSRAACFSHFHSRHCEIKLFERRRRARIDAENGHRRVTRPRLRIFVKETRGIPTGYLSKSTTHTNQGGVSFLLHKNGGHHWADFGEDIYFEPFEEPFF